MTTQTVNVRLKQHIPGLGNAGDVRRVKFGYARNFLVAKDLATIIGEQAASKVINQQQNRVSSQASERKAVMDIAKALDGQTATLTVPANSDGRLFASVQADDVAAALDTDPIFRMDPIKSTGTHTVTLDFGHDIVSNITVTLRSTMSNSRRTK